MRKPFLTVYGHVSIDQILSLKEFPKVNTSVDILTKKRYLGGTGANIATISAALGTPTAISSFVGDDFPDSYRLFMEANGLDLEELITIEEDETSTALIINNEEHDQITYFFQGPLGNADPKNVITKKAKESEHVHFSTGNPRYYLRAMDELQSSDAVTSLDPAQEAYRIWSSETFVPAIENTDILFSNQHEMPSMLNYLGLQRVEDIPVKTIILTKGAAGSMICIDGEMMEVPAIKADRVIDTTGAGDGFRAGLYSGLYRGYDITDAATIGAATASFIIEAKGALSQIPTWEQVLERANL